MSLPPAARKVATAIQAAVQAATVADAEALREAAARLSSLDSQQTGKVLGTVARKLLEHLHPDGLDGDDIRSVLEGCVKSALPWLPEVDPHVLLVVLAGALGIHPEEHEGVPRPGEGEVALHAPILVAELLTGAGLKLDPYLAAAFEEIARTEIMDAP